MYVAPSLPEVHNDLLCLLGVKGQVVVAMQTGAGPRPCRPSQRPL